MSCFSKYNVSGTGLLDQAQLRILFCRLSAFDDICPSCFIDFYRFLKNLKILYSTGEDLKSCDVHEAEVMDSLEGLGLTPKNELEREEAVAG